MTRHRQSEKSSNTRRQRTKGENNQGKDHQEDTGESHGTKEKAGSKLREYNDPN